MKTKLLIPLLFLALILTSCGIPDANFVSYIPVVREKIQDRYQRENHEAKYHVVSYNKEGNSAYSTYLVLPENFAQVGDHFYFNGTNMYAGPMEMEKNK